MLTKTNIIDLVTNIMLAKILSIGGTSFDDLKVIVDSSQKPNDDIPINNKVPNATTSCDREPNPNGLSNSLE